jgi:hypothetical protein
MNRGTAVAGIVRDEAHNDTKRGFVAGYTIEKLALGIGFLSAFLVPGPTGWGRKVSGALEKYKYMSGVWICGEDLAQEQNRIELHPTEKDQYGLPAPVVYKTDHPNDTNMRNHSYQQMEKIYNALGSTEIYNLPAYPASHNMGTNRMSEKPRDGVLNKWGQSHDIKNLFVSDGSQFTSSGSPNPTLTIVALAIRQAEYLAGEMQRGHV